MTRVSQSSRRRGGRWASRKPLQVRLETRGRALLALGVVSFIAAYALPRGELLFVGGVLVALPLVSLATVRFQRHRFAVERAFAPPIAEAGSPVTVTVTVRTLAATLAGEASWRDEWPWAPYGNEPARLPLPGGHRRSGTVTVQYVLQPPKRGVAEIGPFVIDVVDPFQLARGDTVLGGTQELVVTPRLTALPEIGLLVAADEGDSRVVQRQDSGGGHDTATRQYRHGDPLSRVHWKATARQGELMVRQEEQRRRAHALIVLETRRAGYRDAAVATEDQPQSDSFEWALAFAGSLALHLRRRGFEVGVQETGSRQLADPQHEEEFLLSLAAATLADGPPSRRILSAATGVDRDLGSVFAILAEADSPTVHHLVSQRTRFDSTVAFVVNAHSDVVLDRLRSAGWTCVAVGAADDPVAAWHASAGAREAHRASQ